LQVVLLLEMTALVSRTEHPVLRLSLCHSNPLGGKCQHPRLCR